MSFGARLRQERQRRLLSQGALAEALGTSARSIIRWEQDQVIPHEYARRQLCSIFNLRPEELFAELDGPEVSPRLWNVPYSRNPFFTGREEILHSLHELLNQEHAMALTQSLAISGLGGIGKTQIALEYAYQYRQEYRFIFWTRAATREVLQTDIVAIADLLQLPERHEQNQEKVLQAVRQWFATHEEWLWILDNADDVTMIHDIFPTERPGHLLLTSRAQTWSSLAQRIEVETMGLAEGTLFLLRRAKQLGSNTFLDTVDEKELAAAEAIVLEVDFLPLALDQAGAYIEEVGCSISAYLELYKIHRKELLQRRGHSPTDHPEPVATTWSLSFQKIEQANPAAADLLRLCGFLEPDAIPEELISEGGMHLGPVLSLITANMLKLNAAIEELRKFSLIQRYPETRMLRIHRLVQAVLKETMEPAAQKQWAERTVQAVNAVFPLQVEVETWPLCRRYLPQAQSCNVLIQGYKLTFEAAASLLLRTADYLQVYALYEQAVPLYLQALHIRELALGTEHPEVASVLTNLATVYKEQGNVAHARQLCEQALRIYEQTLGMEHPDVAKPLLGLARLHYRESQYEQAKPLFLRTIHIYEQAAGQDHPDMTEALIGLARLYYRQGQYEQAEQLYQRILHIRERTLGPEHPEVASVLNNLATLYTEQSQYERAEPFYQRALHIRERTLGPEHPEVASVLNNLAALYRNYKKYAEAEPLLLRAVHIWEHSLGPEHMDVSPGLDNLAELYSLQGKYEQAEPLFQRCVHIIEQALYPDHPFVTYPLNGLANLYRKQGKEAQAEAAFQRALHIRESHAMLQHPDTAQILHDFAGFREAQGKSQEAEILYQRALAIREHVFGPEHPTTMLTRTAYSALLQTMARHDDATCGEAKTSGPVQTEHA